ncbi:MAG: DUF5672 family protein [Pseudomonadota bacterium]
MKVSLAQIEFADALLFTDHDPALLGLDATSGIRVVAIDPITSSEAYSRFMLEELADHIETDHCLIVQWDGHVIDAGRWQDAFLEYDYIGASWPQFDDGYEVGNGGFSLRSRRLLEACRAPEFERHHPEDLAICRTNRAFVESLGLSFAPVELANQFSTERTGDPSFSFGYHGVFLMPQILGVEVFWRTYQCLSDRKTVWADFGPLVRSIYNAKDGLSRAVSFALKRLTDTVEI